MICKKCKQGEMEYDRTKELEVYLCNECGAEITVNEEGKIEKDYQGAWQKLDEYLYHVAATNYGAVRQKMAEILKEQA